MGPSARELSTGCAQPSTDPHTRSAVAVQPDSDPARVNPAPEAFDGVPETGRVGWNRERREWCPSSAPAAGASGRLRRAADAARKADETVKSVTTV